MPRVHTLTISAHDAGSRADAVVARDLPDVSRALVKTLAREGKLRIAGRRIRAAHVVQDGDVVELELPTPEPRPLPALRVLRVDDALLYVSKPAGLHTVRVRPDDPPTLADAVRAAHPECANASPDPREAGALHRLDRPTTGVVAFARTPEAWTAARARLDDAWKLYLARADRPATTWPPVPSLDVRPHPAPPRWPEASLPPPRTPGVEVTAPLSATGPRGRRVEVDPGGQPAASRVWALDPDASLFAVQLLTGRRHQVRVHMASLGLPLAGDPMYGTGGPETSLALHAWAFQLGPDTPMVVDPPPRWVVETAAD